MYYRHICHLYTLRICRVAQFPFQNRVRAGYRCGEYLFGNESEQDKPRGIVHIIGERLGSGHHNFSAYLSAPPVSIWKEKGKLDHNISKVVSGISDTALKPVYSAKDTAKILSRMFKEAS